MRDHLGRMSVGLLIAGALTFSFSGPVQADPGKALYKKHCQCCHGMDGKGKEKMLKPLKLVDKGIQILDILKESAVKLDDAAQIKLIFEGKNEMMPLKGKVTEDEAKLIVAHLRKLQAGK